jgi:hypothetical protein
VHIKDTDFNTYEDINSDEVSQTKTLAWHVLLFIYILYVSVFRENIEY